MERGEVEGWEGGERGGGESMKGRKGWRGVERLEGSVGVGMGWSHPYNTLGPRGWKTATPTTLWSLGGCKLQPLQHFGNLPSREAKYFEICGNQIFCFFEKQKSKIFCPPEPRKSKFFASPGKKESKTFCFLGEQKDVENGISKYFDF